MSEEKALLLRNVPLLASLGEELMQSLADGAELVAFRKGDLVVRENEPGDALFAVVSGRLQAYTSQLSGGERVFATYSNGDYFGEMPLLSGETHWCNVRALNDSVLLKIPRTVFDAVIQRDPRVAGRVFQRAGSRIRQLRQEKFRAKGSTIMSLYSAVAGAGKSTFAANLASSLAQETREPVLLLDFSSRRQGQALARLERVAGLSTSTLDELVQPVAPGYDRLPLHFTAEDEEHNLIAPLFGRLVRRYDYILVDLPNRITGAVFRCLLQSDRVYLVARNEDDHLYRTHMLLRELQGQDQALPPKVKVVLTAVGDTETPYVDKVEERVGAPVACLLRWIPEPDMAASTDDRPHVLQRPMTPYSFVVRRMARELGNVLVGLALGTGGARGFSHIGVIRVLEREGIAVDVVAGSSMGALIGGAWACGKSADEMEAIALQIRSKRAFLKLLDPMFPGAGVFRGRKVAKFLHSIVGDRTFADTMIPLKIVASDLNTMEEVVFEDGPIVEAIRASISIPGIFRPVLSNGHTLIDGGITDPVPVQVLAQAGVAKIIAVNTIPNVEEMTQRHHYRSEIMQLPRRQRRSTMREVGALVETPSSIIDIYMRSMHAMQSQMSEHACLNADVVLRPILREALWYDFYHPKRYIDCGEKTAEAMLPQLKELVATS